jgi:hypothetical protein
MKRGWLRLQRSRLGLGGCCANSTRRSYERCCLRHAPVASTRRRLSKSRPRSGRYAGHVDSRWRYSRPKVGFESRPRNHFLRSPLACPRCGGRLRLVTLIERASVVQRILRHLGLPTEVPEPRPARAPPRQPETFEDQSRDVPEFDAAWRGRRVRRRWVSAPRVVPVPRRSFPFGILTYLADNRPQTAASSALCEGGGLRRALC